MQRNPAKPVTLKDIARVMRLSVPAVSSSLIDNPKSTVKISEVTRERVRLVAAQMGYRPNLAAKSLSKGKTQTVGIITFQSASAQSYQHIRELRPLFAQAGLSSLLNFVEEKSRDALEQACHAMIDARVSGVLLYLALEQSRPQDFDALKKFGLPLASVGGSGLVGIPRYLGDEAGGFHQLTTHLLEEGYRRIALVTYKQNDLLSMGSDRTHAAVRGFQSAVQQGRESYDSIDATIHRLDLSIFRNQPVQVPGVDDLYLIGYLAMRQLIAQGSLPEALIFQADGKAQGALRACAEAGLRVPQDVAIAGFNNDRTCSAGYMPLTSVALPLRDMTNKAASHLIAHIAGPSPQMVDPAYLPCEVMVRQSTSRKSVPIPPITMDLGRLLG